MIEDKNANEISKLFKLPAFDLSKRVLIKPMGDIIKTLTREPAESTYEGKRSQLDIRPSWSEELHVMANRIGDNNIGIACKAMDRFLGAMYSCQYRFCEFVRKLLSDPATVEDKRILQEIVRKCGPLASVAAYYKQQEQVSPVEALNWLRHKTTEISTLVSTPYRRIFLAKVDKTQAIPRKHFKALWLRLSNECHIVLVSKRLANTKEVADAIWHELDHIRRRHFSQSQYSIKPANTGKEAIEMGAIDEELVTKQQEIEAEAKALTYRIEIPPFAIAQSRVDSEDKRLDALWVSQHLRLQNGAGIIIDAGSSNLEVWRAIVDQIEDNQFAFLIVYTNSYQVLEHWRKRLDSRQVQQTNVQLIASKLDAEHLAFYGPEVVQKVMNPGFRAMNVYIGTSGIEFDEKSGSICFGYHGPREERDFKELLFQCKARRRVILATPRKIGFAGGRVFNVLDVKGLSTEAPIYLVTTNPESGSKQEEQFERAKNVFKSETMEQAISAKGLTFHWVTVDNDNGGVPKMIEHIVVPRNAKSEIV